MHAGGLGALTMVSVPINEWFSWKPSAQPSSMQVLNALAIDPGRTWKGPWRWFDESMLECCEPLEVVREKGICISKLTCLAQCNGATTKLKYGDVTSLHEFREVREVPSVWSSMLGSASDKTYLRRYSLKAVGLLNHRM
jgi:hypothetical protein